MSISNGKELDVLVVECVLGRVPCDNWKEINLGSAGGFVMMRDCRLDHQCYPRSHPPGYSTHLEAAWQVIEYLAIEGWDLTIRCIGSQLKNNKIVYEARIEKPADESKGELIASETADTAPLAICLVALQASGYKARGQKARGQEVS
ncbi:MAG: hypothetical protein L0226_14585 [Acidobacteria bacterium]|nr:hypothetical protein [Acidobacteriota bacterium]